MPSDSWKLAPGLNNVGSYQVSGRPFASGSCLAQKSGSAGFVVRFPTVTKWVMIEPRISGSNRDLRVAFSQNGLHDKGNSYFRVNLSSSLRGPLDLKVSELWFASEDGGTVTFDIVAGLTSIPVGRVETEDRTVEGTVTAAGQNWSGSLGVG
jgi:hypothetical protein